MELIDNLSTIKGRKFLNKLFYQMRYEKQIGSLRVLFACLRICISERDTNKFIESNISIIHPLGVFSGTKLWLEEILYRYYFTTISSFVYFGAAILLTLVGFRKFYNLEIVYVIYGLLLESFLLIVMFVTMFFAPNDDIDINENELADDLLDEIGEIATDFAKSVDKLDNISYKIEEIVNNQNNILNLLTILIEKNINITNPNDEFKKVMEQNIIEIQKFSSSVSDLNNVIEKIKEENVKYEVRTEIEKLLNKNILNL